MINQTPLEIYKGATTDINGVVKLNGVVQDITGCSLAFKVKWQTEDSDDIALLSLASGGGGITIPTPASGIFVITIPKTAFSTRPLTDTEAVYSVVMTDGSNNVRVLASGPIRIKAVA